ncbi:hypothetical protein DMT42_37355 [Streptomyces actuosus]|uniref:Pentapeptide repeat-containing protein n=3 Tax=Streptomyces TaxID=1883 RepID=A0A2U9PBV4_STRAS|nr:hypothetical protein DMT42_37355 [Streptomyces actuosus]
MRPAPAKGCSGSGACGSDCCYGPLPTSCPSPHPRDENDHDRQAQVIHFATGGHVGFHGRVRSNSGTERLRRLAHRRTDRHGRNRHGPDRRGEGGMSRAERISLVAAALPGLTALVALVFTWMSVEGTRAEVQIAEQGQITNRFNAAVRNLGSDSADVRLGGIHGLQRIMQDSARDQPTIVSVLSAYARQHAPVPVSGFAKESKSCELAEAPVKLATDVQAALNVLANRSADHDGQDWLVDLRNTDLRGAEVDGLGDAPEKPENRAAFPKANFDGADLRHSQFIGVDLQGAGFFESNLTAAWFSGVDLSYANMPDADLSCTLLEDVNLTGARLSDAKLHEVQGDETVNLTKANLVEAKPGARRQSAGDLAGLLGRPAH